MSRDAMPLPLHTAREGGTGKLRLHHQKKSAGLGVPGVFLF